MFSRIFAVHEDQAFLRSMRKALRAGGHTVVAFESPLAAWNALSRDEPVGALITRTRFPKRSPHGIALAQWAHVNCPGLLVFFLAPPELQYYTEGIGMLLATPMLPDHAAERVCRILASEELYSERVP